MFYDEATDVEMIAHAYDLFAVDCLKGLDNHGFADASDKYIRWSEHGKLGSGVLPATNPQARNEKTERGTFANP